MEFFHFKLGGYTTIEWLEIKVDNDEIKNDLVNIFNKVHVPGEVLNDKIKIYGYIKDRFMDYI